MRRVVSSFGILLLVIACAPVSPTAEEDRALFERLCDAPDRNFIKRKLVVEGYAEARENRSFDSCPIPGTPMSILVENSFKFYECLETPWTEIRSRRNSIYRVELYSKGSQFCANDRIQKENIRASRFVNQFPTLENNCFGIRRTDQLKSSYVLVRGGGIVDEGGTHRIGYPKDWANNLGAISFSRNRILDIRTGEVIAEEKSYTYFPSKPKFSEVSGVIECKVSDSTILDVLVSMSGQ